MRRYFVSVWLLALTAAMTAALAPRLVVISGVGSRGVGLGIARQVLARDDKAEVVVMARALLVV